MDADRELIIRVRDLRYRYPGVADDVLRIPMLDVRSEGLTAITGPSGAGKTTLIELLAGTLREPYQGSVVVLGKEWKSLTRDVERQLQLRRIGLIPQDFGLLPDRTPAELIDQDLADSGVPVIERKERIQRALEQVELEAYSNQTVSRLSGGQKQRVAVARMLARNVDLVIADEPTANLDAELCRTTILLLRQLAAQVPVVVVTHDERLADASDRTIVLQSMAFTQEPPPEEVVPASRRKSLLVVGGVIIAILAVATGFLITRRSRAPLVQLSGKPSPSSTAALQASPAAVFPEIFARESSGVVRIQATSCGGRDIGTGFIIGRQLVATADHVVSSPVTIGLTSGGQTTTGEIIGYDPSKDLALIHTRTVLSGYMFHFATGSRNVGDDVAAFGFPEGLPLTFTKGSISGLDRTIRVQGVTRAGLLQTDTPLNPGNSGGPLVDSRGSVVGLVDAGLVGAQGIGYAIPASTAQPALLAWSQAPRPVAPARCASPLGPSIAAPVQPNPGGGEASSVARTLSTYFNAIDRGKYQIAWDQFSPSEQQSVSVQHLASAYASSFIFNAKLRSLDNISAGTAIAFVTFTSLQSPSQGPNGVDTCDHWSLDYTMVHLSGRWLIDRANPHQGRMYSSCG